MREREVEERLDEARERLRSAGAPTVHVGDGPWPGAVTDGLCTRCRLCGILPVVDFIAADAEWARVVPKEHRPGVVCIECFVRIGGDPASVLEVQIAAWGATAVAPTQVVFRYDPL